MLFFFFKCFFLLSWEDCTKLAVEKKPRIRYQSSIINRHRLLKHFKQSYVLRAQLQIQVKMSIHFELSVIELTYIYFKFYCGNLFLKLKKTWISHYHTLLLFLTHTCSLMPLFFRTLSSSDFHWKRWGWKLENLM